MLVLAQPSYLEMSSLLFVRCYLVPKEGTVAKVVCVVKVVAVFNVEEGSDSLWSRLLGGWWWWRHGV